MQPSLGHPQLPEPRKAIDSRMQAALQHPAVRAAPQSPAPRPPLGALAAPHLRRQQAQAAPQQGRCRRQVQVAAAAAAPTTAPGRHAASAADGGHTALLHSLGEVGDVAPMHLPWLLRLAHIKSKITGGDSNLALQESARGLLMWKVRWAGLDAGRPVRGPRTYSKSASAWQEATSLLACCRPAP